MQSFNRMRTAALTLSAAALLSLLARTFVDYRFVYGELGFDARALGLTMLVHLAICGSWIWALVAASHARRWAMSVLLGYDLLVVAFGLYTMTTLCPSPCRTGWPMGEVSIWSNLLIGVPAAVFAAMMVFRRPSAVAPNA